MALAHKIDALVERGEASLTNGSAQAQARRLLALFMLKQMHLGEILGNVKKAAEWEPITPEQKADEAAAADSLTAHLTRYKAAVLGEPAPIFSCAEFVAVWTRATGTGGDVVDPYFQSVVDVILPILEATVLKSEQSLDEADALTAG